MELRVFTEPQQGATYDQLRMVCQRAERLGFDGFFRSDHYLRMGGGDPGPGPTDAWVTLAGLARETSRIRLGTLLSSATFRLPGPLAVAVAQVDAMSGGRVELGLGAGWFEDEHRALGIPFPSTAERFERLEEQLAIVTGVFRATPASPFSFAGRHYQLAGHLGLPRPVQEPRPPLIVGGLGAARTPRLAARFADELNLPFPPLAVFQERQAAADRACEAQGRDPAGLRRSVALVACCGEDETTFRRRAAAIGRDPAELREHGACGLPGEVVERLGAFAAAGASRAYLQVLDLGDLEHLELLAAEVLPAVSGLALGR
jgi:F420-dependent oxidoreductase-like protein